jgi:membrane protease YdiL (CAAX protease family)
MEEKMNKIKPIGFTASFLLFFLFGVLFAVNINIIIPLIVNATGINPFIVAQVVNTCLLFIPIFLTAFIFLKSDGIKLNWENIKERFSFKKLVLKDFFWIFIGLFVATIITIFTVLFLDILPIPFDVTSLTEISPIMFRPLQGIELLFLLFMPISFFFNYAGEEILWRGYLFPRQEIIFREKTWIVSGILHAVFHLFMGTTLLLFLPYLFAIPFVYSKTKNTYAVIIMHALLGAPADILLAIGMLT